MATLNGSWTYLKRSSPPPRGLARQRLGLDQGDVAFLAGLDPEGVPRRNAVGADSAFVGRRFQHTESFAQAMAERVGIDGANLRFRIVNVINVQRIDAEIDARTVQLAGQVDRMHAMAVGDEIPLRDAALTDVTRLEPLGTGWVRQVTALGTDDEFLALDRVLFLGAHERAADAFFGAFETVIDRRIDDVDAGGERLFHGGFHQGIGRVVRLAQIRAETDRRPQHAVRIVKVPGGDTTFETLPIGRRAFGRGAPGLTHQRLHARDSRSIIRCI